MLLDDIHDGVSFWPVAGSWTGSTTITSLLKPYLIGMCASKSTHGLAFSMMQTEMNRSAHGKMISASVMTRISTTFFLKVKLQAY